jgi:hypothetical protein
MEEEIRIIPMASKYAPRHNLEGEIAFGSK